MHLKERTRNFKGSKKENYLKIRRGIKLEQVLQKNQWVYHLGMIWNDLTIGLKRYGTTWCDKWWDVENIGKVKMMEAFIPNINVWNFFPLRNIMVLTIIRFFEFQSKSWIISKERKLNGSWFKWLFRVILLHFDIDPKLKD